MTTSTADAARAAREIAGRNPDVPQPGMGETATRFDFLRSQTRVDVPVGRLVEAHLDALAILHELGSPRAGRDELWGVWAAEPPAPILTATEGDSGWTLTGVKPWCSGATGCSHALVTARVGDHRPLFAVDLSHPGVRPEESSWHQVGMARADTRAVGFDAVPAARIGTAQDYLDRPGFWHGGIGVAACWLGGAESVGARLLDHLGERTDDIVATHAGRVDVALSIGRAMIAQAAREIDAGPADLEAARLRAFRVRSTIDRLASIVVDEVGRALGPGPLVHDAAHAERVADLTIYQRQSHGDRDLATLGRLLADRSSS